MARDVALRSQFGGLWAKYKGVMLRLYNEKSLYINVKVSGGFGCVGLHAVK